MARVVEMKTLRIALLIVLCAWVGGVAESHAASLRVEKDGSEDYTIIQDALDAAAVGDSILIGAGRFETFRAATLIVDGVSDFAGIMWVTTDSLTIVGAGRDLTYVGPAALINDALGEGTAALTIDAGARTLISGITFHNTRWDVNIYETAVMEDCRTVRADGAGFYSVTFGFVENPIVRRCEILGNGGIITGQGVRGLLVEDCLF
ncbi:MAG: hypothetical protein DRQ56_08130, partial [Gammaproteobacteria bacterium]